MTQRDTQTDTVREDTSLDRMLLTFYDRLSNQMAGGKRIHPEELLPESQDPLEGMFPDEERENLDWTNWVDPAFWAITNPDMLTDEDLANVPYSSNVTVREGKGLDFYRSGEAPNNYKNRHNPLYKARTEFIKQINPQIEKMFGVKGGGVGYYRPPKGSDANPGGRSSNSDHYSAGAVDYYGTVDQMIALRNWAKDQPWVSFVRCQSESHYDHVHLSVDIGWIAKNYFKGKSVPTLQASPSTSAPNMRVGSTQPPPAPGLPPDVKRGGPS